MKKALALSIVTVFAVHAYGNIIVLQDDFEYADQAAFEASWTATTTNKMQLSTVQANSPVKSAYSEGNLARRHWRNFSQEVVPSDIQPMLAEFWMWVPEVSSNGRQYSEVRAYGGGGFGVGSLDELIAIGTYNSTVVSPSNPTIGIPADQTRFQARVAFGYATPSGVNGWMNLDAPGAPTRTPGWHKFGIKILGSGVVEFYVDGILGASVVDSSFATHSFDSFVLGSGLVSGAPGAHRHAYYDDVLVQSIPEPASLALLVLGGLALVRRR